MKISRTYYDWLLYKVCEDDQKKIFSRLFTVLADTEFYSDIERDSNLLEHCMSMREDYKDEADFNGAEVDPEVGPVTLLEIMILLCVKAEDIMQGFDEVNCERWFVDMLNNSGLIRYQNSRYNDVDVRCIITDILRRKYEWNGRGGLFYIPILSPKIDLRDVELWYQLMWYIDYCTDEKGENYG